MIPNDGILRIDEWRMWKRGADFTASANMRAPEGKVLVVQIVGVEDHPQPPRRRKKRPSPSQEPKP